MSESPASLMRLWMALRPHRLPLALVVLAAAAVLDLYYANSPHAVIEFDSQNSLGTPTYLGAARDLLHGHVFSTGRLPGYPLLLAILGASGGSYGPLLAVQAVMFLAVIALTYWIAWSALRRRWIAFAVALLMATDVYAAAYSKEVLSESLALILVAGLLVALVSFVAQPRPSIVWTIAALATATTFTRPEWTFLPLALCVYFAVWALVRSLPRRVIVHGLAATAACYLVIGGYVAGNAVFNGYAGTSEINNISLLGKVMQYDMQLEAPARYRTQALVVDQYVNVTHLNVWHLITEHPEFAANHYALSGDLSRAAILADPVKFVRLSIGLALTHNADVDEPLLHVSTSGAFRLPLRALAHYTSARYAAFWLLPALAVLWVLYPLVFSFRRAPTPTLPPAGRGSFPDAMGPVALVALYGVLVIAFGGFDEYGRYHTVFLPASMIVVWGTLLFNVEIASQVPNRLGALTAALVVIELAAIVLLAREPGAGLAAVVSAVVLAAQGTLLWAWQRRAMSVPR
ncbi:MAG TPA: hypothetical protein VGG90_11535 [Candidatus Dormibacteraeota bacterium]